MAMSTRRKLAIASWKRPQEGNIYGKLNLNATELDAYIRYKREQTGERITVTHVVGKAVALALRESPGLNGVVRMGRYCPHETVDISFLVTLEGGKNLAKAKVTNADQASVEGIAASVRGSAEKLRTGRDENFKKSMGPVKILPTFLVRWVVAFVGFLTSVFGIGAKGLGLEPYPFGSCIITSVGMMGLDEAFVPPTPWAHVPTYVLIGAFRDEVVAIDGAPAVQKRLTLTATIDHRYIDGAQGAILARKTREVLENPWVGIDGLEGRPEGVV